MPQNPKQKYYECPNGHVNLDDDVLHCRVGACQERICPDCGPELAWDLEACPKHMNDAVYALQRERDRYARRLATITGALKEIQEDCHA
jgi:hypothetical protein